MEWKLIVATVLIVDGNPMHRLQLVTLLSHREHRLLEPGEGEAALEIVRETRPDLVITDVLMPTMDGYEFVCQLRSTPTIKETRVIYYTAAYLEPEARQLGEACGVGAMISKH